MRQISGGKATENERKYPYIVAVAIAGKGLDIGLSRRIMDFHKARHIQTRHGRAPTVVGFAVALAAPVASDLSTALPQIEVRGHTGGVNFYRDNRE